MTSCIDYALKYINRYPKTEFELRVQLRKKWYEEREIDETILSFFDLNYVNDLEFTRLYFSSEVEKKGKPLYRVIWLLLKKWVDKDLIESVIEEERWNLEKGIMTRIRKEILTFKKRGIGGVEIIQKLQGRWYSFEIIKQTIEIDHQNSLK